MEGFTDLLILMVVVWTIGKIFRAFSLPMIFGELVGGIIVGPVLLGLVNPDSEFIKIIAEFGIFFLMLHSGLETDPSQLLKTGKKSLLIALGGAILPFLGAYYVSIGFGYEPITALFVGMGISITALPICARLFKDYKMPRSKVAHLTMGSAIINDILALILFSTAINVAEVGSVEWIPLLKTLGTVVLFFVIVIYGGMKISPFMNRVIRFKNKGFTLTLIIALLMGLIAEAIGLHMIIGAFLAGLFIREEVIDQKTFAKIEDRVYGLSYSFFGPIFFASLAFHLDFSAFTALPILLLILLGVAILGKLIGSGLAARLLKIKPLHSLAIGVAMNSRGAVELIVLVLALEMGIIDEQIFSVLVFIAFVTTILAIMGFQPIAKRLKAQKKKVSPNT